MSNIGKIIRVNVLPPVGERENNAIYQVAAPGAATYTDYAVDENGDIKVQAGYSNPQDLLDSAINISDQELLDEGIGTQKDFNTTIRERLIHKLDKPYMDGNAQEYPKVLGLDNNGNTATLPAGDLGKNIANSELTSVAGAGLILGADWDLNTSGHQYSISGLSDVSTNPVFNKFLSQDDSGKIGKTNGIQPFLSLPSTLSESDKIAWKTAMNGGWTTNTMSVAVISPPLADNSDKDYWFTVKGANLNLPPTSFSVELMSADGNNVIALIPNNQVQLYTTGTDLVFYYNFKDIPVGTYRLRLWNGVAYYVTGAVVTIKVVDQLIPLSIGSLTWETIQKTIGVANVVTASGNTVAFNVVNANLPVANTQEIFAAAKSSQFINANKNFYIKGNFTVFGGRFNTGGAIIGVGADAPLNLINTNAAFVKGDCGTGNNNDSSKHFYPGLSGSGAHTYTGGAGQPGIGQFIIIRNGNNASIITSTNANTAIALQNITEEALHIFGYGLNGHDLDGNYAKSNIAIIEGYEF